MAIITVDSDEYGEATHYGFVEGVDEIDLASHQHNYCETAAIAFGSRFPYHGVGDPMEAVFVHPMVALDLEESGLLTLVIQPGEEIPEPIKFDGLVIWLYTINR